MIASPTAPSVEFSSSVGATIADSRLVVRLTDAARREMQWRLKELGIHGRSPCVVIHPGASAPSRRYPIELWAEVCHALNHEHGLELIARQQWSPISP